MFCYEIFNVVIMRSLILKRVKISKFTHKKAFEIIISPARVMNYTRSGIAQSIIIMNSFDLWAAPTASCTLTNPSTLSSSTSSLFMVAGSAGPSYTNAV